MRRNDDKLWKGILEPVFDDFLRFIFPEADKLFDMKRGFEFMEKELQETDPEPDTRSITRNADKLVKVYRRDGKEEWILCHIEVQGRTSKKERFPDRMFEYYCRIFGKYRKPIAAIAIFTAKNGHTMPDRYEHHVFDTSHVYRYKTYCITQASEEELKKSNNPFAWVVLAAKKGLLAEKIPEEELLHQKTLVAKLLLKKGFPKDKVRAIMIFLNNYIVFKNPETNRIFKKNVEKTISKKSRMDIFETVVEIRREKEQAIREEEQAFEEKKRNLFFVKNLLKETDFSINKIASLAGVSSYFVKKVKKELSLK